MSRRGALLFAAMSVIWGIPYLLIRVAVRDLDPAVVVFGRCVVGALVLLPFALRSGGAGAVLRRWRPLLLYTAIEVAAPWWLLTDAEQHLSSSFAGLLIAVVPMIGAAIGVLAGHERLGSRRLLGLLLGMVGVGALLGLDLERLSPWPVVEVLLTATGYALGPFIITRRLADLPSIPVNAVVLSIATLAYLPFALLRLPDAMPSAASLGAVAALGVVCTAVAFIVFFALIAEVGPVRAPVVTYVNPAVAVAAGVLLLGEPLTVGMLVGFPLVLLGSFLATRRSPSAATDDLSPGRRSPAASDAAPVPPEPSPAAGTGRRRSRARPGG